MKTMKKVLSIFLASILVFSSLGMSVAVAENTSLQTPDLIDGEPTLVETEESSLLIDSQGINENPNENEIQNGENEIQNGENEIQKRILPALVIRLAITTGAKYTLKYVAKASQLQKKVQTRC